MEGKELLLKLLSDGIIETDITDLQEVLFENTELSNLINNQERFDSNSYDFLLKLSEFQIDKILLFIDSEEEKKALKASLMFIKGLLSLTKEYNTNLDLNDSQKRDIEKFVGLIKKVIEKNNSKLEFLKNFNVTSQDIIHITNLMDNDELFHPNDYIFIENLVRAANPNNADVIWEKIVTFLNSYNGSKLKEVYDLKREIKTEKVNFNNPDDDIFSHFEIPDKKESPTRIDRERLSAVKLQEKRQLIKEKLVILGLNFDNLEEHLQKNLLDSDVDNIELMVNYLKTSKYLDIIGSNNIRVIIKLVCDSSPEVLEAVVNKLTNDYRFGDKEVKLLLRGTPGIFTETGYDYFKQNVGILKNYGVNLADIIYKCPSFFIRIPATQRKNLSCLEEKGISVKHFIEKCSSVLDSSFDLIFKNIQILENYGFDLSNLSDVSKGCYSVLGAKDLAKVLDQFIELGLNEYIHNSPSVSIHKLKELIVKRIYFAFKNNLPVWKTPNTEQKALNGDIVNKLGYNEETVEEAIPEFHREEKQEYNELIEQADAPTEDEVIQLIIDYPILEVIEEGYRPAIYTDSTFALLKRKTEYTFGNKIISRLKTLKAFNVLVKNGIEPTEALVYSLSHNSILDEREYNDIKKVVLKNNMGEKTL